MNVQVSLTIEVDENLWASFEDGDEDAYADVQSRFMDEVMSMNLEPTIAVDPFTDDELQIIIHAMEYRAKQGWSMHDKNTGRIAMYRSALQKLYKRQAVAEAVQAAGGRVEVQLSGKDGNAFFILGRVRAALRKGGAPADEIKAFMDEATSGDYDHLLQTCMRWVVVN